MQHRSRPQQGLDNCVSATARFDGWHGLETADGLAAGAADRTHRAPPTYVAEGADPTCNQRFRKGARRLLRPGPGLSDRRHEPEMSILREPFFARPAVTALRTTPLPMCSPTPPPSWRRRRRRAHGQIGAASAHLALGEAAPRAALELAKSICAQLHDPSEPPVHPLATATASPSATAALPLPASWSHASPSCGAMPTRRRRCAAIECNLVALERIRTAVAEQGRPLPSRTPSKRPSMVGPLRQRNGAWRRSRR